MPARITMLPASSVVTSVRTIDSPRPVALFNSKRGVEAATVVDHPDVEQILRRVELHHDVATAAALGEAMVDGVLQQLGQHDRQRRGDR